MTKRNLTFAAVALACLPLASLVFVAGCETESATQTDVQINPAYTELRRGESVVLTVSGWSAYRWSLPSGGTVDQYGYLSAGVGDRVVYTVTATPTNGYNQVITVNADVSTEFSPGAVGTARVRHVWTPGDVGPTGMDEPDVHVTPTSAELGVGQTIALRASGWTEYTWRLSPNGGLSDEYGELSAGSGEKVVYKVISSPASGYTQSIVVRAKDSTSGNYEATARIKHK